MSVWTAAVLLATSCARVTPKSALLPSEPVLPAIFTGEKTKGCDHILMVLQALQDPDNNHLRTRPAAFEFSENEINEYLAYSLRVKPRLGIGGLSVRLFPNNEVSVSAVIDFAGVEKWNTWLIPETLRPVIGGRSPVQVDIQFQAASGFGSFKIKNVVGPGNTVIAKPVMEWIIQAIALHQPEWYDTRQDIPLPYGLQRIWTGKQSLFGSFE